MISLRRGMRLLKLFVNVLFARALPLLSEKLRDQRGPPPGLLPSQSGAVSWKLWSCVVGVVCTARPQSKSAAGALQPSSLPTNAAIGVVWVVFCLRARARL